MTDFVFEPAPLVSVAVVAESRRFPVRRVFCVGRNYEAHAKEMGHVVEREAPFFFSKSAQHVAPSGVTMPYAPGTSNLHYEMEWVIAIGKAGFRIDAQAAEQHVFGYACGLDMTRRDLQKAAQEKKHPWSFGKDFEQAAVMGDIVPVSHCGILRAGAIRLTQNGVVKQSSNIDQLIHNVPALIAYLSRYYHLLPGDLIYTGTPEGVGAVAPGDHLHGEIDGVGSVDLHIGAAE